MDDNNINDEFVKEVLQCKHKNKLTYSGLSKIYNVSEKTLKIAVRDYLRKPKVEKPFKKKVFRNRTTLKNLKSIKRNKVG